MQKRSVTGQLFMGRKFQVIQSSMVTSLTSGQLSYSIGWSKFGLGFAVCVEDHHTIKFISPGMKERKLLVLP